MPSSLIASSLEEFVWAGEQGHTTRRDQEEWPTAGILASHFLHFQQGLVPGTGDAPWGFCLSRLAAVDARKRP